MAAMTLKRATLYIGGGSLLIAWLASAASSTRQWQDPAAIPPTVPPSPVAAPSIADVKAKARRLHERLAVPRSPQPTARNPFAFRAVVPKWSPAPTGTAGAVPVTIARAAEPVLLLIGVAERQTPAGLVRTAMLSTERDELLLATVGQVVLGRYTVAAVGGEAVELTDGETGRMRRLVLHTP